MRCRTLRTKSNGLRRSARLSALLVIVTSAVIATSVDPISSLSELEKINSPHRARLNLYLDEDLVGVASAIGPSPFAGVHLRGIVDNDDQRAHRRILATLTGRRLGKEKKDKCKGDCGDESDDEDSKSESKESDSDEKSKEDERKVSAK